MGSKKLIRGVKKLFCIIFMYSKAQCLNFHADFTSPRLNAKVICSEILCLLAAALGLSLQKIIIPQYKFRGETAILECDYQLNGGKRDSDDDTENTNFNYHDQNEEVETLYSVKWYKDGEEFYRFVPKSNPPQNSYKGKI